MSLLLGPRNSPRPVIPPLLSQNFRKVKLNRFSPFAGLSWQLAKIVGLQNQQNRDSRSDAAPLVQCIIRLWTLSVVGVETLTNAFQRQGAFTAASLKYAVVCTGEGRGCCRRQMDATVCNFGVRERSSGADVSVAHAPVHSRSVSGLSRDLVVVVRLPCCCAHAPSLMVSVRW